MSLDAQKIVVRPARREDCPRLLELINELAVYERAPDEVTVTQQHFEESGFGPNPVWWAHVACIPSTLPDAEGVAADFIVGFALYYVRYSTWKGQRMYLEDIIVTEQWRCRGIGSMLMDAIIEDAKRRQFSGIMWQVLEWNEPAIKFYQRYQPRFDAEWVNVSIDFTR
jgi:ribosomal protein S18 acetylase RimI-like enzyme